MFVYMYVSSLLNCEFSIYVYVVIFMYFNYLLDIYKSDIITTDLLYIMCTYNIVFYSCRGLCLKELR